MSHVVLPCAVSAAATDSGRQPNFRDVISSATTLNHLKQIHARIIKNHDHNHLYNVLLSTLSIDGPISYSLPLLSTVPRPPVHLSNKLIKTLSRSNNPFDTFVFFRTMLNRSFPVDRYTFPPLLKAASKSMALIEGKTLHSKASKMGFDGDPFVETALIRFYACCGLISEARLVFDKMSYRDVVSWSTMIDGYCQDGLFDDVLPLLEKMKCSNIEPDERVYGTILSACGRFGNLDVGKLIHGLLSDHQISTDSHLQSALINMYSGNGAMDIAQSVYDKLEMPNVVVSTAMITGYSKAENTKAARLIFDEIIDKDLVSWSAMISAYAQSDKPQEGIKFFYKMLQFRINPDQVTMLSVVSACAHLGALDQAKQIHLLVNDLGFGKDLPINNALIDMYAKCGNLSGAVEVFSHMHRKNVISWTSMICAFAVHRDADNALKYFHKMKLENVEPNWVTFVGVLCACAHVGLVEEGRKLFESMVNDYGIAAKLEHYGCMVDLYGRANLLSDALKIVETMPMAPNVVIWGSLMSACRKLAEFELGMFAASRVLELDPYHDGAHVFLSNAYATEGKWGNVGVIRQTMKNQGILKERGRSMIEMDNEIHEFLAADRRHERTEEIYAKLDEVVDKIKKVGYSPNTSNLTVDLDEDEKQKVILWHSEKLAICYGLIRGERQPCIRIIKNLRICEDCHNFMKLTSKVFGKEIVVRDRTIFHHCKDGLCSCNDYW